MNNLLDYYQIEGGTLPLIGLKSETYVKRSSDEELYQFCRSSHASNRVCSILAPRQMGKTSLMVRIAEQLSNEGSICIQINLQGLGGVRSEDSFWYTILGEICKQLDDLCLQNDDTVLLAINSNRSFTEKMDEQWSKNIQKSAASKVTNFLIEEILQKIAKDCQFILFFDEIQSLISLGFQNSVIGYIKALGDDVRQQSLQKFNIVLLGVAKPSDLLQDSNVTLNIGRQIELKNFQGDCRPLQRGLWSITSDTECLISLILNWTNGQPFLTQFLCFLIVQTGAKDEGINWGSHLEKIVKEKIVKNWRIQDRQSHFQEIENYFLYGDRHKTHNLIKALNFYKIILKQGSILWDRTKNSLWDLLISGLARKEFDRDRILLKLNNKIYEQIFNLHWVETTQNTIAQLEEETPSMTLDRSVLIYKIMNNDLLPELSSFVNRVMSENYNRDWQENKEILDKFYRDLPSLQRPQKLDLDLSKLLSVIEKMWREKKTQNFFNTLKGEDRNLVIGIKNYRNTISHLTDNDEFSPKDASSAIDTIVRLLQAISASESVISKVQGIHRELLQQLLAEESKPQPIPISRQPRNTMQRVQQIENIILQRQPLAAKIKTVEENLNVLMTALDALEQRRIELLEDMNARENLNAFNFSSIRYNVMGERDRLERLRKRLSRDTLNLGVVGLMGQGKSTLLQHLSGLNHDIIPAKVGGACTAVRSTICHQEGETHAEVTVHSEESFLKEVIHPYYVELNLGSLPENLDEFARSLPDFSERDATLNSMYEHLKRDYHAHLPHYKNLLHSGSPRQLPRVAKEEIYKYVSQPRDPRGELIGFEHLIVRSVTIFCPFPNREVGKIALIDVPGLGDTRLGDEQLILETLGQEIDLVLFIRRPDALRFVWEKRDTDLYKTANQALNNLENRSFLILNHVRGNNNNLQACKALKATHQAKHLKNVRCEIIDCSNTEEANTILDSILDYLAANIKALDDRYARTYQDCLDRLHQQIHIELQKVRQYRSSKIGRETLDDSDRIDALFDCLWPELALSLEELVYDFDWEKQKEENNNFQQQVAITIEDCKTDTGLPLTPEQEPDIQKILKRYGSSGAWPIAYAEYLHDIRTHLTRKFESMDMGLQKYVDLAKSIVTDILIEVANLGNLPGLSGLRGNEFIEKAIEIIPSRCTNLGNAFKTLSEFEMTYRKTFRSHIRPYLDNLNPNKTNLRIPQVMGNDRETREQMAKTIFDYLEILQGEAVSKCEIALADLSSEPSKEAFYEIEQFVDQILRSGGSKQEWRSFLRQKKEYIWPAEFGRTEERSQDWLELVEKVEAANQPQKLHFLN
ncbi:MAG: AAA-like domain-containing protein [Cyanobacteria bacterium SBLK]|nr:AAA-like domain-containing protein [Cyanobacteria bacterium SBLK]